MSRDRSPDGSDRPASAWAKLILVGTPLVIVLVLMLLDGWLRG